MNRRGFFKTLATVAAGFTILPPATTYERIWKPAQKVIINPAWETAPYTMVFLWHHVATKPPHDEFPRFKRSGDEVIWVPKWIVQ